jgi:hypothetical protein
LAGKAFAYTRKLLNTERFGDGWELILGMLHGSILNRDRVNSFPEGSTMTMAELRWLMVESGFICAVPMEEAVKEKGSHQLSIDGIYQKGTH